mmetsp:Transcript_5943/g.8675  ORF Transcript_5943/g.8675 Transcript_5943/m.8675 type:complete len:185 (-) Transcript_5943:109-663(-)
MKSLLRKPPLFTKMPCTGDEEIFDAASDPPSTKFSLEQDENAITVPTQGSGSASPSPVAMTGYPDISSDGECANMVSDAGTSSGDESDAQSSNSSLIGVLAACRPKKKRVTWAGLDDLEYVPTRTYPRKRPRRIKSKDGDGSKAKKKSKRSGAKKEKIIATRYLTGTLYTYKGPNPRVEFVRHY